MALWSLWLLARVAFFAGLDGLWLLIIDLSFLPLVLVTAARPVIARKQWRQLPILATLSALWLADLAFHLSKEPGWLHVALQTGALLLLLIGARITPAFSRNWLRAQGRSTDVIRDRGWLPPVLYSCFCTLLLLDSLGVHLEWGATAFAQARALLALSITMLIVLRLAGWSPGAVSREPLLWILHVGMFWVAAGMLLRALALLELQPPGIWQHALGIGALGSMILGVMTRVALGHTGRSLQVPGIMIVAFGLIILAAVLRIMAAGGLLPWQTGITASSLAWSASLLIFLCSYAAVLIRPRPDGRPG